MSAIRDVAEALDELSATRLVEGRLLLVGMLAEFERLAAAVKAELPQYPGPASRAYESWDVEAILAGLPDESARCLLFALAERLAPGGQSFSPPSDWFYWLTRRPLALAVGDVRLLATVAEPGSGRRGFEPFEFVVRMVGELLRQGAVGSTALAQAVADQVLGWEPMIYRPECADDVLLGLAADQLWSARTLVGELRDRVLDLAGRPPAPAALEGPVSRDDGYGRAVLAFLGPVQDWPAGVRELLEHCAAARTVRPSVRWGKQCRLRLTAVCEPAKLLRGLLEMLLTAAPVSYLTDEGRRSVLVGFNEQLIRGLAWAAELHGDLELE